MKRANGMGTIERTPKGLFRVRRAGGKRETLAVLGALDEAESLLRGWNACINDGSIAEPGAVTLGSFGEDWFLRREFHGNKRAEKVRDLDRERAAWTYQVLPSPIAKRPLDAIRVVDVEDWITWASKQKVMRLAGSGADRKPTPTSKTVSAQTVKHALRLIRQVLSDAVAREYISSNPAASVASPKNNGERPWTYATAKEIEQIASLPAEKARPILFAIYTGVRQAELWRMRWRDLDLDRKRFVVRGETKNGKERIAPLLPAAIEIAKAHRAASRYKQPEDFVFCRHDRKPFGASYDAGWGDRPMRVGGSVRIFPGLKTAAGIHRKIRFHDLRHTCASHLITGTWGKPWRLEEVSAFLGHSSISVTQRYAHLADGHLDELAAGTGITNALPTADRGESAVEAEKMMQAIEIIRSAPEWNRTTDLRLRRPKQATRSSENDAAVGSSWATAETARVILRSIASGGVNSADVEALARGVMARDDVRLASEILADMSGPHVLRRAVELAALVLGAGEWSSSGAVEK